MPSLALLARSYTSSEVHCFIDLDDFADLFDGDYDGNACVDFLRRRFVAFRSVDRISRRFEVAVYKSQKEDDRSATGSGLELTVDLPNRTQIQEDRRTAQATYRSSFD